MAALQKNPKLKDLTTDQQQHGLQSNVVVDRVKASQLGIQAQQVDSALYSAFGQRAVSVVYNDRDQFHVILEASPQYLADPTALDKIYISGINRHSSSTQRHCTLSNFLYSDRDQSPGPISRGHVLV